MKRMYTGTLDGVARPDGTPLPHRLDLRNHSPDGFSWGYMGSGPSQLSLALLADVAGDEFALQHYFDFKCDVVCALPIDNPWSLTESFIKDWCHGKLVSALNFKKVTDYEK